MYVRRQVHFEEWLEPSVLWSVARGDAIHTSLGLKDLSIPHCFISAEGSESASDPSPHLIVGSTPV